MSGLESDERDVYRECEELRGRGRQALDEGRYQEAFSLLYSSILSMALQLCREDGIHFSKSRGAELSPTELLVGLAIASEAELRERGEEASIKLSSATWLFAAAAQLRTALDEVLPLKPGAFDDKLAELTLRGFVLGQADGIMTAVRLGWLDKLAAYEVGRARRSAGAAATNAARATIKQQALGRAMQIVSRNPCLSHEDVAVKVRDSLALSTTVKTLTDWVRHWRRDGSLPVWKKPPR